MGLSQRKSWILADVVSKINSHQLFNTCWPDNSVQNQVLTSHQYKLDKVGSFRAVVPSPETQGPKSCGFFNHLALPSAAYLDQVCPINQELELQE